MLAKTLVNDYLTDVNRDKVNDANHMKRWIEEKYNKKMNRPFYIYRGKGGGNEAKLMWSIWNPWGNNQQECYFYTDIPSAEKKLEENNHISLQRWIDNTEKEGK